MKNEVYRNTDCWYESVCLNDCTTICERYIKMKYLMDNSGLHKKQQIPSTLFPEDCDVYTFEKLAKLKKNIFDFIQSGQNLFICSEETGNGKTSWSIKLLLKYFDQCWPVVDYDHSYGMFVSVPKLLMDLKDFNNPLPKVFKDRLLNSDVVVWDDIAHSSNSSNYDTNNLLYLIDQRLSTGLSNIYTSNVTSQKSLEQILSAKTASRIWDTSTIIEFVGRNQRG